MYKQEAQSAQQNEPYVQISTLDDFCVWLVSSRRPDHAIYKRALCIVEISSASVQVAEINPRFT